MLFRTGTSIVACTKTINDTQVFTLHRLVENVLVCLFMYEYDR